VFSELKNQRTLWYNGIIPIDIIITIIISISISSSSSSSSISGYCCFVAFPGVLTGFPHETFPRFQFSKLASERF
jgi:hypothetical protein